LAFSLDGKLLAARYEQADLGYNIIWWDLATGEVRGTLDLDASIPFGLVFSLDAKYLAAICRMSRTG
jgi:hypothetical protein